MSNPYLQRLQALKTEKGADDELTKLTNPRTEVVADAPSTDGLRIVSFVSICTPGGTSAKIFLTRGCAPHQVILDSFGTRAEQ